MERIEFLDMVIEQVKQLAKPGDSPMAYAKTKDNKLVVSLIALNKKYQTCMALEALRITTGSEEMVLVQEAWAAIQDKDEEIKCSPSENPDRKECFVVNYFSKDKCIVHILEFEHIKGRPRKLKWTKETNYWNSEFEKCESRFNPFAFTKEDIEHFLELSQQDEIKEKGKKEVMELAHKFHVDIYRLDKKAFLEAFNGKGEVFFSTKVTEDNSKFEESLKQIKSILDMVGGLR